MLSLYVTNGGPRATQSHYAVEFSVCFNLLAVMPPLAMCWGRYTLTIHVRDRWHQDKLLYMALSRHMQASSVIYVNASW
jgi:hypothetical protein